MVTGGNSGIGAAIAGALAGAGVRTVIAGRREETRTPPSPAGYSKSTAPTRWR